MKTAPFGRVGVRVLDRLLTRAQRLELRSDGQPTPLPEDWALLIASGGPLGFVAASQSDASSIVDALTHGVVLPADLPPGEIAIQPRLASTRDFHWVSLRALDDLARSALGVSGVTELHWFRRRGEPAAPTTGPGGMPPAHLTRIGVGLDDRLHRLDVETLAEVLTWWYEQYFDREGAALAVFRRGRVEIFAWNARSRKLAPIARLGAEDRELETVEREVQEHFLTRHPDWRQVALFFVEPAHSWDFPEDWREGGEGFLDALAFLTDDVPGRDPRQGVALAAARRRGVPVHPDPDAAPLVAQTQVPRGAARPEEAGEELRGQTPYAPDPRPGPKQLARNACRLDLSPRHLSRAWRQRAPTAQLDEPLRRTLSHWVRALANRQVGVAICGGGALCYRLVPLLRRLHESIPIDVVSGVSGGALLGAYYAARGLDGLERYVAAGTRFQLALLRALIGSNAIRDLVDRDLARTRLEELEVRFAGLATALPRAAARPTRP